MGPGRGDYEGLSAGISRPIPRGDGPTLEDQLARLQKQQHKSVLLQQRQDLFDADPWDHTLSHLPPLKSHQATHLTESTSGEQFYSLDLHSSLTSSAATMEDSFVSTDSRLPLSAGSGVVHRRCIDEQGTEEPIALHDGVGLQQLAQSPPTAHHITASSSQRGRPGKQHALPHHKSLPACKYSLTLSGLTVALLQSDPAHTYTMTRADQVPSSSHTPTSSMDEGGLDPVCYFQLICELLKGGVNHQELKLQQKELAQILPADHLLLVLRECVCAHVDMSHNITVCGCLCYELMLMWKRSSMSVK